MYRMIANNTEETSEFTGKDIVINFGNLNLLPMELGVLKECAESPGDRFWIRAGLNMTLRKVDTTLSRLKWQKLVHAHESTGFWQTTKKGAEIIQ